jgi:hypothetical protein
MNKEEATNFNRKYSEFIKGLELQEISLKSAKIDLLGEVNLKSSISIKNKDSAKKEKISDTEFVIFHKYILEAVPKRGGEALIRISCEFKASYRTTVELTPKIFDIFKQSTLRLNTWPYFREFVQNTVARMNLPPLTAPLLKT